MKLRASSSLLVDRGERSRIGHGRFKPKCGVVGLLDNNPAERLGAMVASGRLLSAVAAAMNSLTVVFDRLMSVGVRSSGLYFSRNAFHPFEARNR
jgi:hypothetical protein